MSLCSSFVEGRVPGRRVAPAALFDEQPDLLGLGDAGLSGGDTAAVGDLLGGLDLGGGGGPSTLNYVGPKQVWLDAETGKGLKLEGTFARRSGQMFMDMTFTNTSTQVCIEVLCLHACLAYCCV